MVRNRISEIETMILNTPIQPHTILKLATSLRLWVDYSYGHHMHKNLLLYLV